MICTTLDPLFSLILTQPHLPSAIVLPQGLCTCCSLCLNHSPSDIFMALSAYFLQLFTKNISSSVGTSLATLSKTTCSSTLSTDPLPSLLESFPQHLSPLHMQRILSDNVLFLVWLPFPKGTFTRTELFAPHLPSPPTTWFSTPTIVTVLPGT